MTAKPKSQVAPSAQELSQRVLQLERENRRLRERCEEAELESAELLRSLKNAENTLSFRLGHALIQATKSVDGARALPALLAELRRDSRGRKQRDDGAVSIGVRSVGALAGRLLQKKR